MAKTAPPTEPSNDLFGEMRLNSGCFPISEPTQYAPVSLAHKKTKNGKEIEMKSICHLDSMDFYNKQYYKLIAILRTIG